MRRAAVAIGPADDAIAALTVRVQALEATIAALLAAHPRDRDDATLRQVLAIGAKGLPFKAVDLMAHARVDAGLQAALEAATIGSIAELGAWLRANRGLRDGVLIARLPRRYWQVTYT